MLTIKTSLKSNKIQNSIFVLFTLITGLSFSQNNIGEPQLLWSKENFASYSLDKEILDKRDANSKHFLNEDGTITALIAAGEFHYWEDNRWKTIFHSIVRTPTGFENTTNKFKTYFPQTSAGSISTTLPNGAVLTDMLNMRMYFEGNGQQFNVQSIQAQQGVADFNELIYSNVYGNGIDLRLKQETQLRKMDYILQNQQALGTIPTGADFLVFEETVRLPQGWLAKLEGNEIKIVDENGVLQALYIKPTFRDTEVEHVHGDHSHFLFNEFEGQFEVSQTNTELVIKTLVSLDWLLSNQLNFPVYIDPTVNLIPSDVANWTGYHRTTSGTNSHEGANYTSTNITESSNDIIMLGRNSGTQVYNAWAKFNISTLTSNVCINSADVFYNVYSNSSNDGACRIWTNIRSLENDPVPATNNNRLSDIRDGDIYHTSSFSLGGTGNGWKSKSFTAFLGNIVAAVPSGWFGIGFHNYEGASSHETCRLYIRGRSSADRPYLAVNYTPFFQASFNNQTSGCTDWLPGETRTVSVTVQNVGCTAWTSGGAGNNVNFSWWGSWQAGQDANPRMFPYSNLTMGNSQVITFSVTAPMAPGAYTINADNVRDGFCWFRNNNGVCGPGNTAFSFPINVTPTAISTTANVCVGGVIDVSFPIPTGGTLTTSGADNIHTFTTSGTFNAPSAFNARVLVVAGGGGGSGSPWGGGGGGGGGVIHHNSFPISSGNTIVTVGAGGAAETTGQNSLFGALTAFGGGAANTSQTTSTRNGGSGGGAGHMNPAGAASSSSQTSNNGGTGYGNSGGASSYSGTNNYPHGSGGGAGGAGATGQNGGAGISIDISGSAVFYGAGGGQKNNNNTNTVGTWNLTTGGGGGGGNGGVSNHGAGNGGNNTNGGSGVANRGGGGGGSRGGTGGTGGSGVVIVRYTRPTYSSDNPSVATVNTSGIVTGVSPGTANITVNVGSSCQNIQVTVGGGSTAPTSVSGGGNICEGNVVTLTSVGGTNNADVINAWYEDGCNNAFTQVWNSQPYTIWNSTVNSNVNGVLSLSPVAVDYGWGPIADPMIDMSALGSFDPSIYKYLNIRYRVTSGDAVGVEAFFYNTAYPTANGANHAYSPVISDGQWHVVALDLSQNPNYVPANGNITGWRYDWAVNLGCIVELDFIQLSQYPMIDENGTDNTFTVAPGSPYYPLPGQTRTFATAKIDNCGATTCQQGSITLGPQTLVLASNGENQTCIVNANETVHFYAPGTGNYITTVQAGATSLGNVTATVYDDGAPQLVNACGNPSPSSATHVMERHWVITPTTNGPANVYLPYFTAERTALMAAANGNANPDDDVANQAAIKLSKYSGGAWPASLNVDADPNNNCPPPHSTGAGGTELINNNGFGTVQAYIPTFPIITEYSRYPITGFSEFWLHGQIDSPLPVSMKSFSASCSDDIHVTWTTASEQNTSHFVLQRSRDLNQWEDVKVVNSMGTTSYSTDYHVVDNTSLQKAYYRLKQVDLDGNTEFIGPISIDCDKKNNSMIVYPNPTNAGFTVEINAQDNIKEALLAIYDISGKLVQTRELNSVFGSHLITFDKESIEPGTYLIVIEGKDKHKFVPLKLIIN
jgi:hypothetical protein